MTTPHVSNDDDPFINKDRATNPKESTNKTLYKKPTAPRIDDTMIHRFLDRSSKNEELPKLVKPMTKLLNPTTGLITPIWLFQVKEEERSTNPLQKKKEGLWILICALGWISVPKFETFTSFQGQNQGLQGLYLAFAGLFRVDRVVGRVLTCETLCDPVLGLKVLECQRVLFGVLKSVLNTVEHYCAAFCRLSVFFSGDVHNYPR